MKQNNSEKIETQNMHPVFINLSNHPSDGWSKEQTKAAELYGEVIDIAFPQVPPEADEETVRQMALDIAEMLTERYSPEQSTVHVMGEMTYVYALVSQLRSMHFTCVASTTERVVEILSDGQKKSLFRFCRFRRF